ncbi:hypothetical protein Cni_G18630 [Canna indica]|uniref:Secreted protein n=1 Tax=Canna indica TaxID=4628 RepID=A0AAQ3KLG2_9LILI|nr:hypothetical protein Cni_G18630 [Canna indica]
MKLVVFVVVGVLLVNSCLVMPRKVLVEEMHADAGGEAQQAVENYSDANPNNHHYIPRDQYNNYVNTPGNLPGNGPDVGRRG